LILRPASRRPWPATICWFYVSEWSTGSRPVNVLSAVVEEFKARAAADRYAQGQVAIGLLQTRLTDGESALATARGQVAKYIAANPSIGTAIANGGIESAKVDPQFADLQRSVDSSQREADTARSLLASARLDVSTGVQGDQLSFRITDQVQVSATASRQLKNGPRLPDPGTGGRPGDRDLDPPALRPFRSLGPIDGRPQPRHRDPRCASVTFNRWAPHAGPGQRPRDGASVTAPAQSLLFARGSLDESARHHWPRHPERRR